MAVRVPYPVPQQPPERGRILLRDGGVAEVRPLSPEDEPALRDLVQSVSSRSLADRFLGSVSRPQAVRYLEGEGERSLTLCVTRGVGPQERIVAVGTYVRSETAPDQAEVSFLVRDEEQGRGIGTGLLERLAMLASQVGIRRFVALVRADNVRMLEVFRRVGLPHREQAEGADVWVELQLRPTPQGIARFEERDRIATVNSLIPLFRPRSIAVVGASRDRKSIGRRIFDNLITQGFEGPVYPVNRSARVVGAVPAYPSVADLPETPDLCVVAVPRQGVEEVLSQAGQRGVRAAVVVTAGFAETGAEGRALQQRLVEVAHGLNMRLVGPNCLGLINTASQVHMNASFAPHFPPPGRVAMSSQSGALGLALLEYAREHGLGISSFVSVGNKADVSGNDLLQYWEEDPDTDLIVLYLESFGNPRRFARLARRVGRKKPVLVVKAARTEAGTRAAASHTAALASSETATSALFAQAGVIRADTLEELFDLASLLANQPLPRGPRVAIVTNAGGPGILATDALAAHGMQTPAPSVHTVERLRQVLPPEASLRNPVDMIASATANHYRETLRAVLRDEAFDAVQVIFIPLELEDPQAVLEAIRSEVAAAHSQGIHKPVVATLMESGRRILLGEADARVPVYPFPESAARALAAAWRYAHWREEPEGTVPDFPDLDVDRARALVRDEEGWLAPEKAFELLSAFGLPVLPTCRCSTPAQAREAAERMGFPVVVKLASRTLLHKSDWNGVRLGLQDGRQVEEACWDIRRRLEEAGRAGDLEGYVVQPMATGNVELMLGVTMDPVFGPLVAFGLGGTDVEALGDVTFRVLPVTDTDARSMLTAIRGHRLLEGYRGRPPVDRDALTQAILRLARLAEELPEVAEIDLNPVLALTQGGLAIADARVRIDPALRPTQP